jgi:hypothetical protein
MRKILACCLCFGFLICGSNLFAVTKAEILGDYKLVSLKVYRNGTEILTRNSKGRASCTEYGLVFETQGEVNIRGYWEPSWYWSCGFYEFVSSNRIIISIVGEDVNYADVYYSNNLLSSHWDEYLNFDFYEYETEWEKINKYYTQEEYDEKPAPEQKAKVVVIPMM